VSEWLRVFGDTQWFEQIPVKDVKPEASSVVANEPVGVLLKRHQPMPKRRTPSGEEAFTVKGSVPFSPGRETGRNLGTLVHQMMEQVAWIDEAFDEASDHRALGMNCGWISSPPSIAPWSRHSASASIDRRVVMLSRSRVRW